MMRSMVSLAFAASVIAIAPATAQEQEQDPAVNARFWPGGQIPRGEIIFFSGQSFGGARFNVRESRSSLLIPFTIRSVVVLQGESWEVCSQASFRDCTILSASSRNLNLRVRSARPYDEFGGSVGGQSLRGMASQYYPAPTINGRRVRVPQGTAAAAQDRATRFCRRAGFNHSRFQLLQTVSGQVFLADVLCTRS